MALPFPYTVLLGSARVEEKTHKENFRVLREMGILDTIRVRIWIL